MATTLSLENSPQLARVADALRALGKTPDDCVGLVGVVKDSRESQAEVFSWKQELQKGGVTPEGDALERVLLTYAVQESAPKVQSLPVHEGVKALMLKEFQAYLKPPGPVPPLLAGTDPFVSACKIASLRRFIAGPIDWVISGMPRSWIPRIPLSKAPQALLYIATRFGGLKPAFYLHIGPAPRNRSLIIPKEVRKAYYRLARSLELQPRMKGILCASWFHDQDVLRDTPHLGPLNEPYLEHGGRIVATLGPAPADSGYLDQNPERRKLYESGQFRPRLTLAMWPRKDAIRWAEQHSELDG
jgi:hypothetical protein